MNKNNFLVILLLCSLSSTGYAMACDQANVLFKAKSTDIIPRWGLQVNVKHKQRVYFHTAPKAECKLKDLFIIRGDSVTAYDLYKDASQEEWVYVIYYSKRQDLDSEIVEGWVQLKDFEYLGSNSPLTQ